MEEIIKKSNRLPDGIQVDNIVYILRIEKVQVGKSFKSIWNYMYIDTETGNRIIDILHKSLQACLDETLHALKELNKELMELNKELKRY